jgi:hypothetical protein
MKELVMGLYAWTQDVPIDAAAYADITARMGDAPMPGLVVHLALERPDGRLRYVDVWESEEACDAAFEAVVHPAVHPVLAARGIHVAGEPPREPLRLVEVRLADGPARV